MLTHFLNGLFMIAMPILLGIYLTSKLKLGWKAWLVGAAVFILSQILHLPFNLYLLNPYLSKIRHNLPGVTDLLVIASLLGASAGIFETFARYAMYRWWLKDERSWSMGVMAGAGHGGIEAILLGVIVMVTFFNMVAYRQVDLSMLKLLPEQLNLARQQILLYWSLPWYDTMLGALERMLTIPVHIAASVLVLQVFTRQPGRQKLGWLGLAILLHSLLDASAVFISQRWGAYATEAVLAGFAVLAVVIIFTLRQPEPTPIGSSPPPAKIEPPMFTPIPVEVTSENLEKTRYQ